MRTARCIEVQFIPVCGGRKWLILDMNQVKIVVMGDTSSYESVPQSSGPPEKAARVELISPKWNMERMRDVTLAEECPRLLKSDEKIHKNKNMLKTNILCLMPANSLPGILKKFSGLKSHIWRK